MSDVIGKLEHVKKIVQAMDFDGTFAKYADDITAAISELKQLRADNMTLDYQLSELLNKTIPELEAALESAKKGHDNERE